MRAFFRISLAVLLMVIFMSSLAHGWTWPRRITDHQNMIMPLSTDAGRNLYLVAWGPPGEDFRFLCSTNNGYTWSSPVQPADTFYDGSTTPDIESTPNGLIHVVWVGQYRYELQAYIFHQSSSDGGRTWSNRHIVYGSEGYFAYPHLTSKRDTLFLAFRTLDNLLVKRSFDNGMTWQDSSIVGPSDNMSYPPTILYSRGRLHLIYEVNLPDMPTGYNIFYNSSDDLGFTWTPALPISSIEIGPPFHHSQDPSAYADENGHVVAAWFDYQYGSMCGTTGDILGRISTDNGDSWLPETRLTYTQSGNASSCLILNDIIYIAWNDTWPLGCDYPKIMLSYSSDWGTDWSQPSMITGNGNAIEQAPFLLYSINAGDTSIHCLYDIYDPSNGSDIYYVRNKPFYVTHIPKPNNENILSVKAYPNVFNSSTMISIDNSEGGDVDVDIYNILGQNIWHNSMDGKDGNIIWDAKDMDGNGISSGTYFVKATSGGNETTIKLIYLK